jgi:hypothetical protein
MREDEIKTINAGAFKLKRKTMERRRKQVARLRKGGDERANL